MISSNLKKLCENINYILDKMNNVKYIGEFTPILHKHKFSSSKNESIRIVNNGSILQVKGFAVNYNCPSCFCSSEILLKKFIHKNTIRCLNCKEDDEKNKKQSEFLKKTFSEFGKICPKNIIKPKKFKELTIEELIEISKNEFESESDSFKTKYFDKNPTEEDFLKMKDKIKIDDVDMDNVKFYPHIKVSHSHKYSPKIIDINGNFKLLYNLTYICDCCESEFNGRNFKNKSTQYKILCRDCSFSNKTFKIKHAKNIRNEVIRYQSKPEFDLIRYCNYNSVLIQNGPSIDYIFNGKNVTYKVDFRIKDILIEIKDDHIWHRNELESGKWQAKESAAREYCKLNNLEYRLVMMEDVKSLKDHIVRYHWFK